MPVLTDTSTVSEHVKLRRPRSEIGRPIPETDPNPRQIPTVIQTTTCKSTISSLLLSTFSPTTNTANATMPTNINGHHKKKKTNFTSSTFRGLGCTAGGSQKVSLPEVIRASADWSGEKLRKKKQKKNLSKNNNNHNSNIISNNERNHHQVVTDGFNSGSSSASCVDFQDVWCGPGIGFSADATASVDCVVSRRNVFGRGKIDGDKMNSHREPSFVARQTVGPETISFLDSDPDFAFDWPMPEVFRTRYSRHIRYRSPEGRTEMKMLQRSLLVGGRLHLHDRFRDWRLDVDNMSYEELLELGEKIGNVNTGLKEDEISRCIRKIKLSLLGDMSLQLSDQVDRKCIVCQEEYGYYDEMGKLECGHGFHIECIKGWLLQKNICPVCKTEAVTRQ